MVEHNKTTLNKKVKKIGNATGIIFNREERHFNNLEIDDEVEVQVKKKEEK